MTFPIVGERIMGIGRNLPENVNARLLFGLLQLDVRNGLLSRDEAAQMQRAVTLYLQQLFGEQWQAADLRGFPVLVAIQRLHAEHKIPSHSRDAKNLTKAFGVLHRHFPMLLSMAPAALPEPVVAPKVSVEPPKFERPEGAILGQYVLDAIDAGRVAGLFAHSVGSQLKASFRAGMAMVLGRGAMQQAVTAEVVEQAVNALVTSSGSMGGQRSIDHFARAVRVFDQLARTQLSSRLPASYGRLHEEFPPTGQGLIDYITELGNSGFVRKLRAKDARDFFTTALRLSHGADWRTASIVGLNVDDVVRQHPEILNAKATTARSRIEGVRTVIAEWEAEFPGVLNPSGEILMGSQPIGPVAPGQSIEL